MLHTVLLQPWKGKTEIRHDDNDDNDDDDGAGASVVPP